MKRNALKVRGNRGAVTQAFTTNGGDGFLDCEAAGRELGEAPEKDVALRLPGVHEPSRIRIELVEYETGDRRPVARGVSDGGIVERALASEVGGA
jgi:hypothetical protein